MKTCHSDFGLKQCKYCNKWLPEEKFVKKGRMCKDCYNMRRREKRPKRICCVCGHEADFRERFADGMCDFCYEKAHPTLVCETCGQEKPREEMFSAITCLDCRKIQAKRWYEERKKKKVMNNAVRNGKTVTIHGKFGRINLMPFEEKQVHLKHVKKDSKKRDYIMQRVFADGTIQFNYWERLQTWERMKQHAQNVNTAQDA